MKNKPGKIYMLTSPSGKSYIGKTIQSIEKRMKAHKYRSSKSDSRFGNALRKYGIENFELTILHDNVPNYDLNSLECHCIWIFNTLDRVYGYNNKIGGEGSNGYKHSAETIQKMKDYKITEEHRQNIKNNVPKGKDHHFYGKTHSTETKQKIRETKLGSKHSEETKSKMSKSQRKHKRKPHTKETKEKIRKALKGRKVSEKTRQKMRKGQQRRHNKKN